MIGLFPVQHFHLYDFPVLRVLNKQLLGLMLSLIMALSWPVTFLPAVMAAGTPGKAFNYQKVVTLARQLAAKSYQAPEKKVPEFLLRIDYDDWRDIRFRQERALWIKENLPFVVQFFHPGLLYDRPVKINVVNTHGVRPLGFSPDLFDYGKNDFKDRLPRDLGFAGFRIHYSINTPEYKDEIVAFLGATYFRAVAKQQNYGLSARALAIDTATLSGEEFPFFREFWLLRPSKTATELIVLALVDTPSLAGAYRFVIRPGRETVIDVTGRLFMREKVEKLCLAPLTSMFFYGEITLQRLIHDFRPEVHDSDGLQVASGEGEWIWRPLSNPGSLLVTSFQTRDPVGFGLIQRDQNFDHYQDLEARYESRPSLWVTPIGQWGSGRIELVQIPTNNEYNDNIIAYWVPSDPSKLGQPIPFSYRLTWHSPVNQRPPEGRVVATRIAKGKEEGLWSFLIDFEGQKLEQFPADKPLTAVITTDPRIRLIEQQLYKNSITKGWRLVFKIRMKEESSVERLLPPNKKTAHELRAFIKLGDRPLTETWSYAHISH
ncbi:MAG: glucan biosynthesis protein G [Pseudomonadota bacterium]